MKDVKDIYPLLESIAARMYEFFKEVYKDLAMDVEDVTQENYLYYLDFEKRFANKFREDILFSAIKRYVVWKNLDLIRVYRKKRTSLISMDTEMGKDGSEEDIEFDLEGSITEKILKGRGMKIEKKMPLSNKKHLNEYLLKINPEFNNKTFKSLLGEKKFNIFMEIMEGEDSGEVIGKRYGVSKQRVDQIKDLAIKKIKQRFHIK